MDVSSCTPAEGPQHRPAAADRRRWTPGTGSYAHSSPRRRTAEAVAAAPPVARVVDSTSSGTCQLGQVTIGWGCKKQLGMHTAWLLTLPSVFEHLQQQVDGLWLRIVRHVERHNLLHQRQEVVRRLYCLDALRPLCANLASQVPAMSSGVGSRRHTPEPLQSAMNVLWINAGHCSQLCCCT